MGGYLSEHFCAPLDCLYVGQDRMRCALFGVIRNCNISWLHILSYLFLTKRSLVMWELCQGNCPAWMKCLHHWEHSLSRGVRLEIAHWLTGYFYSSFTSSYNTFARTSQKIKLMSEELWNVFCHVLGKGGYPDLGKNTSDICLPLYPWVKTTVSITLLL